MPTTFTDPTVPNIDGTICYEITAFDTTGNESVPRSNRAIKVISLLPPQAPLHLTIPTVVP